MKQKKQKPKRSYKMWALVFKNKEDLMIVKIAYNKEELLLQFGDESFLKEMGQKIVKVTVVEGW